MAAYSKKFSELLERSPASSTSVIILESTSPDDMGHLLEYMYTGQVNVSQAALDTFLMAAENLQVGFADVSYFQIIISYKFRFVRYYERLKAYVRRMGDQQMSYWI